MATTPPESAAVPSDAITAAIARTSKHEDRHRWLTAAEGTVGGLLARKELITLAVLEAAPAIKALAEDRFAAAAREELAKPLADLGAQITRDAAVAERERIITLAERVGASWLEPCDADDQQHSTHSHHRRKFADLLREEAYGG